MKTVLLFWVLLLAGTGTATAQTAPLDTANGKSYYILLKDGSHIQGRIVKRDSTMYTVRMKNGQLTYVERELFGQISSFAPVTADSAAYFTQTNPAPSNVTQPGQLTVSPSQYVVTLTDGTTLNGQVLSQDSSRVVLKTATIGTVYVPAERVLRMERAAAAQQRGRTLVHPREGYANLFPQYLNFTPTAYQAEPGRVYYRNSYIFGNQFDVGITPNLSLGAGIITPIIPILAGWLAAKVSVPVGDRARIGLQGQYLLGSFTLFGTENFSTNYVQGVVSLGDPQRNLTIGLGKSLGQGMEGSILTVALVRKVKPLLTFISENQLIVGQRSGTAAKLGAAFRFDRQRHSFDVSGNLLVGVFDGFSGTNTSISFTPWASYQVRLGK